MTEMICGLGLVTSMSPGSFYCTIGISAYDPADAPAPGAVGHKHKKQLVSSAITSSKCWISKEFGSSARFEWR
jgi:hypothetical protein